MKATYNIETKSAMIFNHGKEIPWTAEDVRIVLQTRTRFGCQCGYCAGCLIHKAKMETENGEPSHKASR